MKIRYPNKSEVCEQSRESAANRFSWNFILRVTWGFSSLRYTSHSFYPRNEHINLLQDFFKPKQIDNSGEKIEFFLPELSTDERSTKRNNFTAFEWRKHCTHSAASNFVLVYLRHFSNSHNFISFCRILLNSFGNRS